MNREKKIILLANRSPILAPLYLARALNPSRFADIEFEYSTGAALPFGQSRQKDHLVERVLSLKSDQQRYIMGIADPFRALRSKFLGPAYDRPVILANMVQHQAYSLISEREDIDPKDDKSLLSSNIISQPKFMSSYSVLQRYLANLEEEQDENVSTEPNDYTIFPVAPAGEERRKYNNTVKSWSLGKKKFCYITTDPRVAYYDKAREIVNFSNNSNFKNTIMSGLFCGESGHNSNSIIISDIISEIKDAIDMLYDDPMAAAVYLRSEQFRGIPFHNDGFNFESLLNLLRNFKRQQIFSTDMVFTDDQIARGVDLRINDFLKEKGLDRNIKKEELDIQTRKILEEKRVYFEPRVVNKIIRRKPSEPESVREPASGTTALKDGGSAHLEGEHTLFRYFKNAFDAARGHRSARTARPVRSFLLMVGAIAALIAGQYLVPAISTAPEARPELERGNPLTLSINSLKIIMPPGGKPLEIYAAGNPSLAPHISSKPASTGTKSPSPSIIYLARFSPLIITCLILVYFIYTPFKLGSSSSRVEEAAEGIIVFFGIWISVTGVWLSCNALSSSSGEIGDQNMIAARDMLGDYKLYTSIIVPLGIVHFIWVVQRFGGVLADKLGRSWTEIGEEIAAYLSASFPISQRSFNELKESKPSTNS